MLKALCRIKKGPKMKKELLSIIKDKERIFTENIPKKFLSDGLQRKIGNASALVFVKTTAEVSQIMKYAYKKNIAVTIRGAGTNLVGSTVPTQKGIVLDLSKMNRILEIDCETLTATVEAGVLLKDLAEKVLSIGYFYPPDPGEKNSTIGGNIATNAGGMRAIKYGVTRDYVHGLEAVLADGSIINMGGKTVKDASGLSLKNLIVGSEGTLAVVTKCILKLVPKPETFKSVILPYKSLTAAIISVAKLLKADIKPTAIEFIEESVLLLGEKYSGEKFPSLKADAYLLIAFDGSLLEVNSNIEKLKNVAFNYGAKDVLPLNETDAEIVWKIRGCLVNAVEAINQQEPVDIVVPIDKTAEFVNFVHKTEANSGIKMVAFGHAGDGNVHLCVIRDKNKTKIKNVLDVLYAKAYELNGLTSGEHGIGLSKKTYFFKNTPKINLILMRNIKKAFDKKQILNKHISYLL